MECINLHASNNCLNIVSTCVYLETDLSFEPIEDTREDTLLYLEGQEAKKQP